MISMNDTKVRTVDNISARELIKLLLDLEDLDMEVFIKNKKGKRLHGVTIVAKKGQGIGALFG